MTGLIIIIIILILLLWTFIEQEQLVTTGYTVNSDKLPKAFHNTGFVVLSDLHNDRFGRDNQRLIRRIEALNPEFIIIAGDMINKKEGCCPSDAFNLMNQLAKKHQIYYAYGNHEQELEACPPGMDDSGWLEFKEALKAQKVTFLNNESIRVEKNGERITITGVSIDMRFFEHKKLYEMEEEYLSSLIGVKQNEVFDILVAHSPSHFINYAKWGADLIISGHLHGGMLRLPYLGGVVSPQVMMFPKYTGGMYKENKSHMIVSRGLGSHSFIPRYFNIPQIVHITLVNNTTED